MSSEIAECPICGGDATQNPETGVWRCENEKRPGAEHNLDNYRACPDCSCLYEGSDPYCPGCINNH